MKASELKELIRQVVAEEVKRQLPGVLSEMYLKKIVSENVSVAPAQKKQVKKSLSEVLEVEDERPSRLMNSTVPPQMTREQLRERFRNTIADPEVNPMASLYEGTVPVEEVGVASEGVPLDNIPGMRDFSAFVEPTKTQTRAPIPETKNMIERRLEEQRRKLDNIKVG